MNTFVARMRGVQKSIRLRTWCFKNETINFNVRLHLKSYYERPINHIHLYELFYSTKK